MYLVICSAFLFFHATKNYRQPLAIGVDNHGNQPICQPGRLPFEKKKRLSKPFTEDVV
jgi:hypothetical protein